MPPDGIPLVSFGKKLLDIDLTFIMAFCYFHLCWFLISYELVNCVSGKLLKGEKIPEEEENFQKVYVKAPSFLSIHMGVKAEVLPPDTDCHHFVLEVLLLSVSFTCLAAVRELIKYVGIYQYY